MLEELVKTWMAKQDGSMGSVVQNIQIISVIVAWELFKWKYGERVARISQKVFGRVRRSRRKRKNGD